MDEVKTNYTDEEIYVLAELQLGKPPATRDPRLVKSQSSPANEGQYYNDLTDYLFRVVNHDLLRMRALRVGFYDRHNTWRST